MALKPRQLLVPNAKLIELASAARAILSGRTPSTSLSNLLTQAGPVYGELRQAGRLLVKRWETQPNHWASFYQLLHSLRSTPATNLFLCFCHQPRTLDNPAAWRRATTNINRGLFAYDVRLPDRPDLPLHISPFAVVSQNRPLSKFVPGPVTLSSSAGESTEVSFSVREFHTEQFSIDLQTDKPAERLFRGSRVIPIEHITESFVEQLQLLLTGFLKNSLQPDGRLVYLYYPSRGGEDKTKNNAIRQWMATRALCHAWKKSADHELAAAIAKNIAYNLKTMYVENGELGLINDAGKVKLGAVALAALALRESPVFHERQTEYRRLVATVAALWHETGQFRTFFRPADRMDCQNFYPGEALVLWAAILAEDGPSRLSEKFEKSVDFYQQWHLANRNPAFIPWHTQAYYKVWQVTRDQRLAEAILAMNDWLLDVQQWATAPTPDARGRFYDPHRPFGPPHVSSTGVYLEGLADAFALARETGDEARAKSYRTAILRGLRSIAQLTFKNDLDMFYIARRRRVRGGVRTTEFNNIIRIDNVQHCLMAIHKVLAEFSAADFKL
jgi:hypothetical protein